jgi:radical SAM/Cys-rich protein
MSKQQIISFIDKLSSPLSKDKITVLQVNLGKKCNLACTHCHVEASPKRTEELSPEICQQLIEIIYRFPQIETIDLTGGAPEMNYGFKPLVEAARNNNKEVIVRSNLTIFFEEEFTDLPEYFAKYQLRVVASLPCYLEDNVDRQRGNGVYNASIRALQKLNRLGYAKEPNLIVDLVYNPPLPKDDRFCLPPDQEKLEKDYKLYLKENFQIDFNHLFTITNIPVGRTKSYLERYQIHDKYLAFLETSFNDFTLPHLMCRQQLSIDYLGNVYDCDFNQMMNLPATTPKKETITLSTILETGNLDIITKIATADYCYGCTAGSGSSCGGSLV